MKRLCYGTFAHILELCAPQGISQLDLHDCLYSAIVPNNSRISKEQASRLFACGVGHNPKISTAARSADAQTVADCYYKNLLAKSSPLIIPNKIKNALLAIRDVIREDDTIKSDTVIDTISRMTKRDILSETKFYANEIFAGVCLYVVGYVANESGKDCLEEINQMYIDGFDAECGSITLLERTPDFSTEFGSEIWAGLPKGVDGNELLREVGERCPVHDCCAPLRPMLNGQIQPYYRFLLISSKNAKGNTAGTPAYIALCPNHFDQYKRGATTAEWEQLRAAKARISSRYVATSGLFAFGFDLYKEAKQVLKNFEIRKRLEMPKADYGIVDIAAKIHDTESAFYEDVQRYVAVNYMLLNTVVADYGRENTRFDPDELWEGVHHAYIKIKRGAFSQEEIFDQLSKWLVDQTDSGATICKIMTAYFVQQCAVFDRPGDPKINGAQVTGGGKG